MMYQELKATETTPSTNGHSQQNTAQGTKTCGPALRKMLEAFPYAEEKSNGWYANLDNPTFDFQEKEDGSIVIHSWTGRTTDDILAMGKLKPSDIRPYGYRTTKIFSSIDLIQLAQAKRIHWKILSSFGLEDGYKYHGRDCIKIPYFEMNGELNPKKRVRKSIHGDKFTKKQVWDEGTPGTIIPYGLHKLDMARQAGYLLLGEGESDGWTCWAHDTPYLGIPGADFQKCLTGINLNDIPVIYIILEPDQYRRLLDNGAGFYKNVRNKLRSEGYTGKIFCVDFEKTIGYKDPSALHISLWDRSGSEPRVREQFKAAIEKAKSLAIPANDQEEVKPAELDISSIDKTLEAKDIEAFYETVPVLAQMPLEKYAVKKIAIKKAFGSDINMNFLDRLVNEARKKATVAEQPTDLRNDLDGVAELFYERCADSWAYDARLECWRQYIGTHWDTFKGTKDEKLSLDAQFRDILHEKGFDINSTSTLDCVHRCAQRYCKRVFQPAENVVNFKNGTLDVTTMQLREHNKDDDLLYCLPYDYDEIGACITINTWLNNTLGWKQEDGHFAPDPYAVQILKAHMGLSLISDTRMQYTVFMKGAKGAGKSTILDLGNLTTGVVSRPGEVRYAPHDIFSDELEGKRSRYEWHTERLVCVDELPTNGLGDEQTYKKMSAHGGVGMRGIGKDEIKDNQWKSKMLISCNEAPVFKDVTGAIKRRNVYICAPVSIPEKKKNVTLIFDMTKELGAYARECILLALIVRKLGYYPQSTSMKDYALKVSNSGNPLKTFVEDRCVLGNDAHGKQYYVPTMDLYNAYRDFCEGHGYKKPLASNSFVTSLIDMDLGVAQPSKNAMKMPGYDKQKHFLFGIGLAAEDTIVVEHVDEETDVLVDGLDGLLTSLSKARQPLSGGSRSSFKDTKNSLVDGVDELLKKIALKGYLPLDEDEGIGVSRESSTGKSPSTPSTPLANQPVERPDRLTGFSGSPSTSDDSPSTSLEVARQFVKDFCSQPGYALRITEDGQPIITVPEQVTNEEFFEIEEKIAEMWDDLVLILVYNR